MNWLFASNEEHCFLHFVCTFFNDFETFIENVLEFLFLSKTVNSVSYEPFLQCCQTFPIFTYGLLVIFCCANILIFGLTLSYGGRLTKFVMRNNKQETKLSCFNLHYWCNIMTTYLPKLEKLTYFSKSSNYLVKSF